MNIERIDSFRCSRTISSCERHTDRRGVHWRSPSRPAVRRRVIDQAIRIIVPFAIGGGADIVGRAIAQKLAEGFGQQVIVDNRPGAVGNFGTEMVRTVRPTATLAAGRTSYTTNVHLFRKLSFDPVKDFERFRCSLRAPTSWWRIRHCRRSR